MGWLSLGEVMLRAPTVLITTPTIVSETETWHVWCVQGEDENCVLGAPNLGSIERKDDLHQALRHLCWCKVSTLQTTTLISLLSGLGKREWSFKTGLLSWVEKNWGLGFEENHLGKLQDMTFEFPSWGRYPLMISYWLSSLTASLRSKWWKTSQLQ